MNRVMTTFFYQIILYLNCILNGERVFGLWYINTRNMRCVQITHLPEPDCAGSHTKTISFLQWFCKKHLTIPRRAIEKGVRNLDRLKFNLCDLWWNETPPQRYNTCFESNDERNHANILFCFSQNIRKGVARYERAAKVVKTNFRQFLFCVSRPRVGSGELPEMNTRNFKSTVRRTFQN